jgi:copper chaperone
MITFLVSDMTCGHCVGAVTQAIQAVDRAAQVQIDLPTKRVVITSALAADSLAAAVRAAGYSPTPA